MSPSSRPSASSERVHLVASAPLDSEVFLIDHSFELVERSVGTLDVHVRPGIYKVKFRRGKAVHEVITIVAAEPAELTIPFPAELQQTSGAAGGDRPARLESQAAPAIDAGDAPLAEGLSVEVGSASHVAAVPGEGLTLHDAVGGLVRDLAGAATTDLDLPPGFYRLRVSLGDQGDMEQGVVVSPGWQTQVRLESRNYGTDQAPIWRADLFEASMLMTRPGQRPTDEARAFATQVRSWLLGPQETIALAHARALSASGITDPFFALCIAHTLVRKSAQDRRLGRAETRAARTRKTLVKALVEPLRQLIPGHPDLVALSLWLGQSVDATFERPPMLLSSWTIVTTASARRPRLVPSGSLAASIAEELWGSLAWLVWRSDRLPRDSRQETAGPTAPTVPSRRKSALPALVARVAEHRHVPAFQTIALTDLEVNVCQALTTMLEGESLADAGSKGRLQPSRSPRGVQAELVKRLGVPSASVDRAVASILDKWKT